MAWDEGRKGNIPTRGSGGAVGDGMGGMESCCLKTPLQVGRCPSSTMARLLEWSGGVGVRIRQQTKERMHGGGGGRGRQSQKKGGGGVRRKRSLEGGWEATSDSPKRKRRKQNSVGTTLTPIAVPFVGLSFLDTWRAQIGACTSVSQLCVPNNYSEWGDIETSQLFLPK